MYYETGQRNKAELPHDPFKAIVAPRPIGWISTRALDGRVNLAPYSFFNGFGSAPPIVGFSSDGGAKDSASFAVESGEFVANLATFALRDAMNATSAPLPRGESEFVSRWPDDGRLPPRQSATGRRMPGLARMQGASGRPYPRSPWRRNWPRAGSWRGRRISSRRKLHPRRSFRHLPSPNRSPVAAIKTMSWSRSSFRSRGRQAGETFADRRRRPAKGSSPTAGECLANPEQPSASEVVRIRAKEFLMSGFSELFSTGPRNRRVALARRRAANLISPERDGRIFGRPLFYAALGVAVGAAIASLLLRPRVREALVDAGDRARRAAGDMGADALDTAKDQAGKVADRARAAAKPFMQSAQGSTAGEG